MSGSKERLPTGWAAVSIEDVLAPLADGRVLHHGWSPQCEADARGLDAEWGVLKTTAIQDGAFAPEHNKRLPATLAHRPELEVRDGDLLLTCAGPRARCGVACYVRRTPPKLILSGKMYRFRVHERLMMPSFLEAQLRSPEAQAAIDKMKTGISDSGLNLTHGRFLALRTLVPPIAEQRRIVEALETHFTRLDAAIATLERARANLKRYRASVLQAAVEGRLGISPSPRGALPAGWQVQTLDELSDPDRSTTYGVIKLGEEVPHGVPTLRTSNVRHLRLDVDGVKRIAPSLSNEYRRTVLRGGEILVAVRGTLGGVVVAPKSCAGWNVSREVAVVALRDPTLAPVVALFLASPKVQAWLNTRARGIAYTGINIATLKETPIPVPRDDQRDRIVEAAERALTIGAATDAQISATETRITRLRQSLLRLAFDGRLVPHDPRDEPASVLLDRIRAERNAAVPTPKKKSARSRR